MNPDVTWSLYPAAAVRYLAYRRMERWDADRLGRRADALLCRLVRHAARHVPYYRDLFRAIGLDAATFRGRVDLPRIPPLDKEVLRTRIQDFIADDAGRRGAVWKQTSGSTGTPLKFMLDFESRSWDAAAVLRSYGWAGFRPGTRSVWIRDYYQSWEYRHGLMGRTLVVSPRPIRPDTLPRLWKLMHKVRPAVLIGYPSTLNWIVHLAREAGLVPLRPWSVICVGETLTAVVRGRLSEFFGGARIFDYYSMTENAALISECPQGTRHVLDDYAWHEFVDGTGHPVPEGRAEIVGTSYYNLAMPLIRYRTRDLVRLRSASEPCPCGRAYRAVETVDGRREDAIVTADGRRLTLVTEPIEKTPGIAACQFVQEREDLLRVNFIAGADFCPAVLPDIERCMVQRVGGGIRVEFRRVEELERRPGDGGKIPFVLSRLPAGRGCAADVEA